MSLTYRGDHKAIRVTYAATRECRNRVNAGVFVGLKAVRRIVTLGVVTF
jgi:hypothetical protein